MVRPYFPKPTSPKTTKPIEMVGVHPLSPLSHPPQQYFLGLCLVAVGHVGATAACNPPCSCRSGMILRPNSLHIAKHSCFYMHSCYHWCNCGLYLLSAPHIVEIPSKFCCHICLCLARVRKLRMWFSLKHGPNCHLLLTEGKDTFCRCITRYFCMMSPFVPHLLHALFSSMCLTLLHVQDDWHHTPQRHIPNLSCDQSTRFSCKDNSTHMSCACFV